MFWGKGLISLHFRRNRLQLYTFQTEHQNPVHISRRTRTFEDESEKEWKRTILKLQWLICSQTTIADLFYNSNYNKFFTIFYSFFHFSSFLFFSFSEAKIFVWNGTSVRQVMVHKCSPPMGWGDAFLSCPLATSPSHFFLKCSSIWNRTYLNWCETEQQTEVKQKRCKTDVKWNSKQKWNRKDLKLMWNRTANRSETEKM